MTPTQIISYIFLLLLVWYVELPFIECSVISISLQWTLLNDEPHFLEKRCSWSWRLTLKKNVDWTIHCHAKLALLTTWLFTTFWILTIGQAIWKKYYDNYKPIQSLNVPMNLLHFHNQPCIKAVYSLRGMKIFLYLILQYVTEVLTEMRNTTCHFMYQEMIFNFFSNANAWNEVNQIIPL